MSATESMLPKLTLANSVSSGPFSSSAVFMEIGEFVNRCFPSDAVVGSWGTLFVVANDLAQLSGEIGLAINHYLLIDDAVSFDGVDKRVVFVASGGPSAVVSEQYSSLTDAIKLLEHGKHMSAPAVLIHTSRSPRVYRFWWHGLEQPGNELKTYVGGPFAQVMLEDFSTALKWVDEHAVCPAGNIDQLWQVPEKSVPFKNAERRVQTLLRNGLSVILGKDYVIEECSNAAGRADIIILPSSGHFPTHYIELKVVRTYHSVNDPEKDKPRKIYGSRNRRWVLSAIRQAATYKGQNKNAAAHARIYDMRENRSEAIPDQDAIDAATKRNVSIGICLLHCDTEKLQEALTV